MILSPLSFLLALFAIPIILLYILRLRRQDRVVSSTFLWRRANGELQANAPWQRLRPSAFLVLQLLILSALVLALARPASMQARVVSGDVIVIVDESFAMQARDVPPSRFGAALEQAHVLAGELGPGTVMSVIGMGPQPHLVLAESNARQAIDSAIDGLSVGTSLPNFPAAFSLASSLARDVGATRVVVLTSHDSGITRPPGPAQFLLEIVRLGGWARDVGIVAFTASRAGGKTEAVLRVHNFGDRLVRPDVDLFVDGLLADVRPLTVAAGKDTNVSWSTLPVSARRLQAHLTVKDDMPADKSVEADMGRSVRRPVVLVTSGDYFLQTALSLDPAVELHVLPPASYLSGRGYPGAVVVFDGILPDAFPNSPTFLIDPPTGHVGPLRFGAARFASGITSAATGGLLRYVDLSDVRLTRVRASLLPDSLSPLAVTGPLTLIAAGEVGGTRTALISFDPRRSNWPLLFSYPIVIHNLLEFLAGASPDHVSAAIPRRLSFVAGPQQQQFGHTRTSTVRTEHQPVDLAWIFGLAALLIVTFEWWYALRR
jgi:Ca-activated chloride channel homolog